LPPDVDLYGKNPGLGRQTGYPQGIVLAGSDDARDSRAVTRDIMGDGVAIAKVVPVGQQIAHQIRVIQVYAAIDDRHDHPRATSQCPHLPIPDRRQPPLA